MITANTLARQGFTRQEIERLTTLRTTLQCEQVGEEVKMRRRMEFVRWMVKKGKLNEN